MVPNPPGPDEIAVARAENVARKAALGPGPDMAETHTFTIPRSDAPPVTVRLLVPTPEPTGLLIYLHGGGWVMGSIDTFDRLGRVLARRSGFAVLMVDYAKAPEYPYPAAVEDAWATLLWAIDNADAELAALDMSLRAGWPLVIGGDSAGGNLATVCARRARDAGFHHVTGQLLIYPVTDSDPDRAAYVADPERRANLLQLWELYCPPEHRDDPDAAPLRAESLAHLPRTLLVTAEDDLLNDECADYAARLAADGVGVDCHVITGLPHGAISYWGTEPEADRAIDVIAHWLRTIEESS